VDATGAREFRLLFGQEALERLDAIGEGLLSLEAEGARADLISSIFREAHNLKGAAAVVGLDTVSDVAHAMEDLLEGVRAGSRTPTPDLIDALLHAVDGLRVLVPEAVDGVDGAAESIRMVDRLRLAGSSDGLTTAVESSAPQELEPATEAGRSPRRAMVRLPAERLDQMVRLVGEAEAAQLRLGRVLEEDLGADPSSVGEFRDLGLALNELHERSMRAQMVPIATVTESLRRAVRDLARQLDKKVRWEVRGGDTELDRTILEQLSDPLMHLVRNAVDHGIETREQRAAAGKPEESILRLHAMQLGPEVVLALTDDGRGIDVEGVKARAAKSGLDVSGFTDERALELVFRSGLSTTTSVSGISGRGVGLDVVRAGVESVRGRIQVRSEAGAGTEFRISVPITLTVLPCLMVMCGGQRFALPMHSVAMVLAPEPDPARAEGRRFVMVAERALPLSSLAHTLGLPSVDPAGPVVILSGLTQRRAFTVDGLIGQRDVVLRNLGRLLPRMDAFSGASVEPDGSIMLVLDPAGLVDLGRGTRRERLDVVAEADLPEPSAGGPREQAYRTADILVVDDALTVRELQRSILERAGYVVRTATDGLEALAALAERPADLVLTDIEMPHMNGFALTEAIRANSNTAHLPVVIVTTQGSDDSRRRGLEAGADGYIVKSSFDSAALLDAVERLLGPRAG
jgi:two-component system chemotaxis sensor kinase CheA